METFTLVDALKKNLDEQVVPEFQQVSLLNSVKNSIMPRGHLKEGDFIIGILGKMATSRTAERIGLVIETIDEICLHERCGENLGDYHSSDVAETLDTIAMYIMRDQCGDLIYQRWLIDSAFYRKIDPSKFIEQNTK